MSWLTLGVWVCGVAASACAGAVILFMLQNRRIVTALEMQIKGLAETHLMGLDVLTIDLDRLKRRIVDLEQWRDEP